VQKDIVFKRIPIFLPIFCFHYAFRVYLPYSLACTLDSLVRVTRRDGGPCKIPRIIGVKRWCTRNENENNLFWKSKTKRTKSKFLYFSPLQKPPQFTYANLDTVYKNNPIQKRIFIISILLYPILANSG